MTTAHEPDVVDLLLAQHNQMKSLFGQLATAQGTAQQQLFDDLVRLLAVHEAAEEEVVHPVARRVVDDGDREVDARLHEEDRAKRALAELYDLGVDHPEFNSRLTAFAEAVSEHAAHEEAEEFPYLRQKLSAEQRRRLATAVRAAEAFAPTRPHPAVGESAVANLLAGPPLAVFDRVRDAMRDWRRSHSDD